jgi:nucleotide-binding universal stress UspA family protein
MKILLAVDGSPESDAAVDEIAARPWDANSEVRVISAVDLSRSPTGEPFGVLREYYAEIERAEKQSARAAVERAAAKLRAGAGTRNLRITTEVLAGSPKRAIVEDAERFGADLIVVGSHGYGGLKRFLLGSVSQAVALHAPCSVEIVRRAVGA